MYEAHYINLAVTDSHPRNHHKVKFLSMVDAHSPSFSLSNPYVRVVGVARILSGVVTT